MVRSEAAGLDPDRNGAGTGEAAGPHPGSQRRVAAHCRRVLSLTPKGQVWVRDLAPQWVAFERAAAALDEEAGGVVSVLNRLDDALARLSLFNRISELLDRLDAAGS